MAKTRRAAPGTPLDQSLTRTEELVARLLREHRTLRAENQALQREVTRLSEGWEQLRRLARSAPRGRRRR